jgi:hypothetical protein
MGDLPLSRSKGESGMKVTTGERLTLKGHLKSRPRWRKCPGQWRSLPHLHSRPVWRLVRTSPPVSETASKITYCGSCQVRFPTGRQQPNSPPNCGLHAPNVKILYARVAFAAHFVSRRRTSPLTQHACLVVLWRCQRLRCPVGSSLNLAKFKFLRRSAGFSFDLDRTRELCCCINAVNPLR